MVGRALGERDGRQAPETQPPERRDDDALAPVSAPGAAPTRVDEERRAVGRLDEDGLPLADVEDDDAHETVRPGRRGRARSRADGEHGDAECGPAPADPGQQDEREPGRDHRQGRGRRDVDDRAGQGGDRADDEAEQDEQEPEALEERVGERFARGRHRQREHAAGRQQAGERHHQEIRGDPEGRELAEVKEHHRRDPELRACRHGEGGGDRPRTPGREPPADPRPQVQEPGRRRERELEARLRQAARVEGQQDEERRRETVPHPALAPEEARGEKQAAHDGGPQH